MNVTYIVPVHVAETKLSQLLARVDAGEKFVLARGEELVAKLVPFRTPLVKRQFEALRGVISIEPETSAPLPDHELMTWE